MGTLYPPEDWKFPPEVHDNFMYHRRNRTGPHFRTTKERLGYGGGHDVFYTFYHYQCLDRKGWFLIEPYWSRPDNVPLWHLSYYTKGDEYSPKRLGPNDQYYPRRNTKGKRIVSSLLLVLCSQMKPASLVEYLERDEFRKLV